MRVVPILGWGLAFFALVLAVPVSADTLVQKAGDSYKPVLAKSWNGSGTFVSFTLQEGVEGTKLAKTLGERLKGAQVTFANGQLTVQGVPMAALLEQLSLLNVTNEINPLSELASMGGAVATPSQEGGGSIRAGRSAGDIPFPTESAPTELGAHDPRERVRAQVLEVHRGTFPQVTLKLRVLKASEAGDAKVWKRGRVMDASVMFAGAASLPDMQQAANQRNLAAFYLASGDKIALHAAPAPGADVDHVDIDWLERQ